MLAVTLDSYALGRPPPLAGGLQDDQWGHLAGLLVVPISNTVGTSVLGLCLTIWRCSLSWDGPYAPGVGGTSCSTFCHFWKNWD